MPGFLIQPERRSYGEEEGGEYLKEQLSPFPGKGDIAKLVNNEQAKTGITLNQSTESLLIPGFDQLIDQAAAGKKTCAHPLSAGFYAESGGQMSLAGSAAAKEDHIAGLFDVLASQNLVDKRL